MTRGCAVCGQPMPGRRRHARTCSGRCRVALHRRPQGLPLEMLGAPRWLRWALVQRRTSLTKVPLTVRGHAASSTDSRMWSTYAEASASQIGDGLGFVLGGGFAGLDLDHCIVDDQLTPGAAAIVAAHPGAYIERSPSGDGLHILGRAEPGPGFRSIVAGQAVEWYSTARFFTVTGDVWQHGALPPLVTLSDLRASVAA